MLRPIVTLSESAILKLGNTACTYVEDLSHTSESTKHDKVLDGQPVTLSALDLWQNELQRKHLTTFCEPLDAILDGGFQCGNVTEIFGAHGTGKTQICMQTSVVTQLPEECGGLNARSLYIDTRNGFSPTRVKDIIKGYQKRFPNANLNLDEIFRSIIVVSPKTLDDLQTVIRNLKNYLNEDSKIGVVIIDSLSLPVQCSLADGSQRTQFYFGILNELQEITRHNVAVLVVNELRSHIDNKGEIVYASAGGQLVAHCANKRLVLARLNDTAFAARILKSPMIPQISVMFQITEDGITTSKSKAPY